MSISPSNQIPSFQNISSATPLEKPNNKSGKKKSLTALFKCFSVKMIKALKTKGMTVRNVKTKTVKHTYKDTKITDRIVSQHNPGKKVTIRKEVQYNPDSKMNSQDLEKYNRDLVQARKTPELGKLMDNAYSDMEVYDFIKEVLTEAGLQNDIHALRDLSSNDIFEVLEKTKLFHKEELNEIKNSKTDLEGSPYW